MPPPNDPQFFVGVDPGFHGAICIMDDMGVRVRFWDLPVVGAGKHREFDLVRLDVIFTDLHSYPKPLVGIEWPTTRPGEPPEPAERFGRGKGYLEAFAFLKRLAYQKIPPNLWKGRLGLPGKTHPGANKLAHDLLKLYYPAAAEQALGPRGGILDGRVDAALIAHYLRTRRLQGLQAVVDQYGKDSPQAMAMVLRGGRRHRGQKKIHDLI